MRDSYGFIEMKGLASATMALDIALKSANVEVLGLEYTKGLGYTVIKLNGNVSSVEAAVDSVKYSPQVREDVVATNIIARPAEDLDKLIYGKIDGNFPLKEEIEEPVIEEVEEIKIEIEEPISEEVEEKLEITCNLCGDPKCNRKKGEPRVDCINYENK